jgi:ribosomal protein S18 acetylase RimI-like enzyme
VSNRENQCLIRRARPEDRTTVIEMLNATGFFRPDELEIAIEVLDEALAKGPDGHYQSYVADDAGAPAGWVCFGPTPCTLGTFDLYWIAVHPRSQSRGIGKALMRHAEQLIGERGGRLVVVETSGRPCYEATRRFYCALGYHEAATLPDFYAAGDSKIVYLKRIA